MYLNDYYCMCSNKIGTAVVLNIPSEIKELKQIKQWELKEENNKNVVLPVLPEEGRGRKYMVSNEFLTPSFKISMS